MTRPFALRLILLGLIISVAAYSYHNYQMQQAKQQTIDYAISVSQQTMARQSMELDSELRFNYELLNDASKVSLFPLKDIYREIESAQDKFRVGFNETFSYVPFERISDQQRLEDLLEIRLLSESLLEGVLLTTLKAYNEMQENVGFTEKEIKALEEGFYTILEDEMPSAVLTDKSSNRQENHLRQNLIQQSFYHRLQELLSSASSTFCIRNLQFDQYYPIVLSDFDRVLEPGETKELKIGIGSYTTDLTGKEVNLRVNGQRLKFGREGVAKYQVTGTGAGEKSLHLSATIKDIKTEEVTKGEGLYRYSVKEQ